MSPQNHNHWYRAGLAFSCRQCGHCCAGPQEGYVWVSRSEIDALADHLKISTAQLKQKYLRRVGMRYSLIEKQPGKDCIFLTLMPSRGKGCMVYPVRPLQCHTWPFWKENLRSLTAWRQAAGKCPGLGSGVWYDDDRIEAIRAGDLSQPPPTQKVEQAACDWIRANIDNDSCIQAVREIYRQIDRRIEAVGASCENCGLCCDFTRFGHRLYVTTLEILYLLHGLPHQSASSGGLQTKPIISGRCLYQQDQGCLMRPNRPASCRIFYCRDLDNDFQNELTEQVLQKLRRLHEQFRAVYYYADMEQWLAKIIPLFDSQTGVHPHK